MYRKAFGCQQQAHSNVPGFKTAASKSVEFIQKQFSTIKGLKIRQPAHLSMYRKAFGC